MTQRLVVINHLVLKDDTVGVLRGPYNFNKSRKENVKRICRPLQLRRNPEPRRRALAELLAHHSGNFLLQFRVRLSN